MLDEMATHSACVLWLLSWLRADRRNDQKLQQSLDRFDVFRFEEEEGEESQALQDQL